MIRPELRVVDVDPGIHSDRDRSLLGGWRWNTTLGELTLRTDHFLSLALVNIVIASDGAATFIGAVVALETPPRRARRSN